MRRHPTDTTGRCGPDGAAPAGAPVTDPRRSTRAGGSTPRHPYLLDLGLLAVVALACGGLILAAYLT